MRFFGHLYWQRRQDAGRLSRKLRGRLLPSKKGIVSDIALTCCRQKISVCLGERCSEIAMRTEKQVPAILRLNEVRARTGLSRSSLYEAIAEGRFPRQISIGTRAVGWVESEVTDWINARIAESRKAT